MQIFISMASAMRTRSRRNGLSQNKIGDAATTIIHHTSPNHANQRSNRRKHARETSDRSDDLIIDVKRAKLEVKSSPIRHENPIRNRVVATAKNGVVLSSAGESSPRKTRELLHADSQHPTQNSAKTNGVNGKRERSNISYSDKQVIAQSANGGKGDGKRKLRSEEGAHYKSELSAYFNEYDEVIGNVAKESRQYPILSLSCH